jgi:hypothetical protein
MRVDFDFSRTCSDTQVIKDDSETQSFTSAHTDAPSWLLWWTLVKLAVSLFKLPDFSTPKLMRIACRRDSSASGRD